jgi:hypothetical protein
MRCWIVITSRLTGSRMRRLLMILLLAPSPALAAPDVESWALHGQLTVIEQYHPAFR